MKSFQRPRGVPCQRQRGITLVTALIMLVLLTLLALTSFNVGRSNLQIVSNMQQRDEATAAAQEVLEETISNPRFSVTPDNALTNPCGAANQRCVDTNGDGTADVRVALAPSPKCVTAPVIKNSALDLSVPEDAKCSMGSAQNFGVAGAVDGSSACADSVWDVSAVATDLQTNAQVKVTQGVAVRVARDDVANNCPN
jgi:Tfp pilus assembly protein PilX